MNVSENGTNVSAKVVELSRDFMLVDYCGRIYRIDFDRYPYFRCCFLSELNISKIRRPRPARSIGIGGRRSGKGFCHGWVSNFKLENGWLLEVKFLNSSKGAMALPLRGLTRDARRETRDEQKTRDGQT